MYLRFGIFEIADDVADLLSGENPIAIHVILGHVLLELGVRDLTAVA
jgi:hypothetical protein